jgi:hypothetical protein
MSKPDLQQTASTTNGHITKAILSDKNLLRDNSSHRTLKNILELHNRI